MQARILPMPQNSTAKWSNWMSYLDRVESEIKSLQSYLDYFNPDNTLVNAIMAKCKDSLSGIGGKIRPGVVHRIDKDTSGLIIIAKNDLSHINLSRTNTK